MRKLVWVQSRAPAGVPGAGRVEEWRTMTLEPRADAASSHLASNATRPTRQLNQGRGVTCLPLLSPISKVAVFRDRISASVALRNTRRTHRLGDRRLTKTGEMGFNLI